MNKMKSTMIYSRLWIVAFIMMTFVVVVVDSFTTVQVPLRSILPTTTTTTTTTTILFPQQQNGGTPLPRAMNTVALGMSDEISQESPEGTNISYIHLQIEIENTASN